jgi:hypothetical protein
MSGYGRFRAAVISRAEYDSEGVGYSTVMDDFPMVLGALAVFDQIDILMKPWGRDPVTKLPLFINEMAVNRWTGQITTHGINSSSAYATPTKDSHPPACVTIVQVTNAAVLLDIDNHAKHFVLGVEGPDLNGDDLPAGLLPYEFDTSIPSARWDELRDGMVTLGINATAIDSWRTNYPAATPRDFAKKFKTLIN